MCKQKTASEFSGPARVTILGKTFNATQNSSVFYSLNKDSNIPRTHPYINKEQKKSDKLHDISLFVI